MQAVRHAQELFYIFAGLLYFYNMIHSTEEIAAFAKQGITVIKRGGKEYPKRLENLNDPPEVLYCKGNLGLLTRPAVAIVGTRDCTRYGTDTAKRFAEAFAKLGIVVVSGLADGIDTAAHVGAGPANTIAVLGNGVNYFYPQSNIRLQKEIAEQGLLISEYLPNEKSTKFSFPMRNRIVAALSQAVVIVEADLKSGTMITKEWALDLGIDVFAIPGPITSYASRGTNALIKDASCVIATQVEDVLAVFGITQPSKTEKHVVVQISFEEKQILDVVGREEVHFDDIVNATKMPVKKLLSLLTNMELSGLLRKLPGNYFTKGENI